METLLIELTNDRAYKLLTDLEELQIIKVLKRNINQVETVATESPTAKFRGTLKLTPEQDQDFQKHATDIRNEWQDI